MKSLLSKGLILTSIFCILLTSCNGGGGGLSAGGGIDGTGIMSAGVVSAFGSIIVNGTEFDTSEATVIINGEKVGVGDDVVRDNLEIGMVVRVEGRIKKDGSAVADRVNFTTSVNGPVESVGGLDPDTNEKEIVVLGQTVIVNVITKFKPDTIDIDSIAKDDVVEVSGYFDDTGAIRATFIEKTGSFITESIVEVTGFVTNLNIGETFEINGLTVNYALIADDLPEGIPADDLFVEVEGTLATPGGEMLATDIELGDELDGEDGDEFEIMGFVTDVVSDFEFTIGNQLVIADADTVVVDPLPGGIQPGVKLEAEGSLEGGILYAWEIEFWKPDQIEVEGIVDDGVVLISGFPEFTFEEREDQLFQTNNETEFEDVEPDEIKARMELEVKGVPVDIDQSVVVADKVSFELE